MEEVDGLGGGREVGRLELPKNIWVQGFWEGKKKTKVRPGRKNSEIKKKKHDKKKTTDQVN
jgi:hypothetical protein